MITRCSYKKVSSILTGVQYIYETEGGSILHIIYYRASVLSGSRAV